MKLLTIQEAADVLRISSSLLYELINSGKIIAHRIGNGRGTLRIQEVDLEKYVDECREQPMQPTRRSHHRLKHLKL